MKLVFIKRFKKIDLMFKIVSLFSLSVPIIYTWMFFQTGDKEMLITIPIGLFLFYLIYRAGWFHIMQNWNNTEFGVKCNHCGFKYRHDEYDADEFNLFICPWCGAKDEDITEVRIERKLLVN